MRIPQSIKYSIRIVLILMIILLNWLFIAIFLSSNDYDDIIYKNGGYFYSILTFVLIAFQRALKRQTIHEDLEKLSQENEVEISNSDQWRILIYSVIKSNYIFMIFGLFEIGLFFIVQNVASRQIWELLYFGSAFLFLTGFIEIAGFPIIRSKQGYPKLNMNYRLLSDKIEIKTDDLDKIINFKDIEMTEKYNNMILVKTKIEPKYLMFKMNSK